MERLSCGQAVVLLFHIIILGGPQLLLLTDLDKALAAIHSSLLFLSQWLPQRGGLTQDPPSWGSPRAQQMLAEDNPGWICKGL